MMVRGRETETGETKTGTSRRRGASQLPDDPPTASVAKPSRTTGRSTRKITSAASMLADSPSLPKSMSRNVSDLTELLTDPSEYDLQTSTTAGSSFIKTLLAQSDSQGHISQLPKTVRKSMATEEISRMPNRFRRVLLCVLFAVMVVAIAQKAFFGDLWGKNSTSNQIHPVFHDGHESFVAEFQLLESRLRDLEGPQADLKSQLQSLIVQQENEKKYFQEQIEKYEALLKTLADTPGIPNDPSMSVVRKDLDELQEIVRSMREHNPSSAVSSNDWINDATFKDTVLPSILETIRGSVFEQIDLLVQQHQEHISADIGQLRATFHGIVGASDSEGFAQHVNRMIENEVSRIFERDLSKLFPADQLLPQIDALVQHQIEKVRADDLALPDYALESAGARIVHHLTSATFHPKGVATHWLSSILPTRVSIKSPETILQPDVHRGNCWPMAGARGKVTVRLSQPIIPAQFTLEHVSHTVNPFLASAPKDVEVRSLADDLDETKGVLIARYSYDIQGTPIQTFALSVDHVDPMQFVQLRVLSNHGHPNFTCIYRFRAHGVPT